MRDDNKNCTIYFQDNIPYVIVRSILLAGLLVLLLAINGCALYVTILNKLKCNFSRLFLSCYTGNIIGGVSLLLNDLFNTNGIKRYGCTNSFDHYFLLFFGIAINMTNVVNSTYCRIRALTSMNRRNSITKSMDRDLTHLQVLLRFILPAWLISIAAAVIFMFLTDLYIHHHFTSGIIIIIVPLTVATCMNIWMHRYLNKSKIHAKITGHESSIDNISRVQSIIKTTAISHVAFILIGGTVILIERLIIENRNFTIATTWILRLIYTGIFTMEPLLYFTKYPPARTLLRQFCLTYIFRIKIDNEDTERPGSVSSVRYHFKPISDVSSMTSLPEPVRTLAV